MYALASSTSASPLTRSIMQERVAEAEARRLARSVTRRPPQETIQTPAGHPLTHYVADLGHSVRAATRSLRFHHTGAVS